MPLDALQYVQRFGIPPIALNRHQLEDSPQLDNDTAVLATFTSRNMGEVAKEYLDDAGVPSALVSDDGDTEPPQTFMRPSRLVVANENVSRAREILTGAYGRSLDRVGSAAPV